jgi:EAL domain-containing protein (putative c-di-GMP-specific phosphodiesterase class I)
MAEDPVDYALVEAINQIGHILGLRTIAEWAEDLPTLTQLRALNVDFAQGYGVGEVIPIESFQLGMATAPRPALVPPAPRLAH